MSDALPLPPRPNLEQYRKLAKDLQQAMNNSSDVNAVSRWAKELSETLLRLQGTKITTERHEDILRETSRITERWRRFRETSQANEQYKLNDAQLFLSRAHGFASWPKFAKHLESLAATTSPVSSFEAAADAVVAGDIESLRRLLRENPSLVRERSTRSHRSTLLHYVAANGIEDFRQRTPQNIVEVARLLLDYGADVNAESDAYGGRSTTLALAATSYHPEKAEVQNHLLELLIARGADFDAPDSNIVVSCLRNGRGEAAEFLAARGAQLDLEGACGVGRLDRVREYFSSGRTNPRVSRKHCIDGFAWACEFGRTEVVRFLIDHGVDVAAVLPHHGQTGLHWAAVGGRLETVRLLLRCGAPVDALEKEWGNTPLGWALYGWGESPTAKREPYYAVVQELVQAGSTVNPEWLARDAVRADQGMLAALSSAK